jgi:hypothetical protein
MVFEKARPIRVKSVVSMKSIEVPLALKPPSADPAGPSMRKMLWLREAPVESMKFGSELPVTGPTRAGSAR